MAVLGFIFLVFGVLSGMGAVLVHANPVSKDDSFLLAFFSGILIGAGLCLLLGGVFPGVLP